jgi:hypothetical protein
MVRSDFNVAIPVPCGGGHPGAKPRATSLEKRGSNPTGDAAGRHLPDPEARAWLNRRSTRSIARSGSRPPLQCGETDIRAVIDERFRQPDDGVGWSVRLVVHRRHERGSWA